MFDLFSYFLFYDVMDEHARLWCGVLPNAGRASVGEEG